MDLNKVKTIETWPKCTNIIGLRGFLGLIGYYRIFIQGYGKIAGPLTNMLKKNRFQ